MTNTTKKVDIPLGDQLVPFRARNILEINGASILPEDGDNGKIITQFVYWAERTAEFVHREEFEFIFTLQPSVKASLNTLLSRKFTDYGGGKGTIPEEFATVFKAAFKYADSFQKDDKESLQVRIWFDAEDLPEEVFSLPPAR